MNWLAAAWSVVEKVPPTFWGVVLGSFFSLGGVVLTNRGSDRRLKAQLAHDRELKNRDRELSLRKEVYLAAAEALYAGFLSVSKFANLEIPNDKITETYLEKAPAVAKVQVTGNEATVRALVAFSGELGAVYLRLFAKRVPLISQKQQLAILDQQFAAFDQERGRMLELMKQHNLDGATDPRRWDLIQKAFDFEHQRATETTDKRQALAAALYAAQLDYMRACTAETMNLSRMIVPVIPAVRNELNLPIGEAAYVQIMEEAIQKQEANLSEFMAVARGFIAAQPGAPGDAR